MEKGRIVEQGPVYDLFSNPAHPATKRFVSTLVEEGPPERTRARLRDKHEGRFITLSFRDESVTPSDVFAQFIERGVRFELIHGGIEDVHGRTFGHLTLALTGEDAAVAEAVSAVSAMVETKEVP
nr:NIL domain-containing protein [Nocardioides daedukensis]